MKTVILIFTVLAVAWAHPSGYDRPHTNIDLQPSIPKTGADFNSGVHDKRPRGGGSLVNTLLGTVDNTVSSLLGGVGHTVVKVGVNYGEHGGHATGVQGVAVGGVLNGIL